MNLLTQLLAALAVALLRYLQSRQDLKASIRADLEKESLAYALTAQEWKARAAGNPAADSLRVQPGSSLSVSRGTPDSDGRTDLP